MAQHQVYLNHLQLCFALTFLVSAQPDGLKINENI